MPRADARHPRCPRPRRSWRMRCAVVALLAALTWPAAASAQGNDVGEASGEPTQTVDGSGAADATAPAGPPVNDGTLRPPALDRNALSVRWTSWRLAASASAADSEAWADFETAAAELGATELPAHGLALVRGAVAAREAGQATRAAQLLERARSLAPRSPLPDFLAARWRVDDDVLGFAAAPGRALAGWDRLALTMDGRRALAVAGWSAVFAAICGLIVSLVAPIFARRMPQAAFDVRLLLLRIPTLWQAGVIVALAVAAPAALLWSPAALVGAMILVAAPWARLGERAVLALACGLAVPLPWVADQQALALATAESRAPLHAMATAGWCDARCESELAAQADAGDPGAAIALAAVQFRVGSSERLRRAHALLDGTRPPPELAVAHGALLGNLAYVEGDIDGAERAWRGAIEQARTPAQRAAAAWNLAQLYSRLQLADSERDALLIADGADPLLIDRMTGYRGRSLNRVLLVVPLDEIALYRAALAATDPDVVAAIAAERLDPVLGAAPASLAERAPLGLLAWVVLSWTLRRLRVTSVRCRDCGTPTSRRIYAPAFLDGRCVLCYQFNAVPLDLTFAQRHAREWRVTRRAKRRRVASVVLGFTWPGVALLSRGVPLAGTALAATAAAGAALWRAPSVPAALPLSLEPGLLWDGVGALGLALLATAWFATVSIEIVRARRSP